MAMYGTAAAERRKAREARLAEIRKRQAIADELMADEAKHRASALGAWSRLEERAAKMMGYDEPEQVEQTVTTVPADLMALVQQARAEGPFAQMAVDQRIADNLPCPACGGDRLRPRFDGPGLCHAGGLISDCTCPGSRSIGMEHMDDCPARPGTRQAEAFE